MSFDLRFPVGLMFTVFGLILTGTGLTATPAMTAQSLNINMDLWWGIVQLAFGLFMLFMAIRGRARKG
jgi:intracellular septation protein A